jgi:hypothetical protein
VAGGGYGVVGIPDCVRSGQEAADAIVGELAAAASQAEPAVPGRSAQNSAGSV